MTAPEPGSIIIYPYLWARESRRGETEGRKYRPACVALHFKKPGSNEDMLALFALTTKSPGPSDHVLELPELERRHLKLRDRCWIILDECNQDLSSSANYPVPFCANLLKQSYHI
jgi:hypothetical protein